MLQIRLLIIAFFLYSISGFSQPKIVFEKSIQNAGNLEIGSSNSKKIQFSFRNNGNTPAIIKDVQSVCSCIEVSFPSGEIMPGNKGLIEVTINPVDLTSSGSFLATVHIFYNSADPVLGIYMAGYAHAKGTEPPSNFGTLTDMKGNYGYIDHSGKFLITPQYDFAEEFSEGRGLVQSKDVWFSIDRENRKVTKDYSGMWAYNNGLARVKNATGHFGYVDVNGKELVPLTLTAANDFTDGISVVSKDNQNYLLTMTGTFIKPKKNYYQIGEAREGLILVKDTKEGKHGFINYKGEEVIPCQFETVSGFFDGLSTAKKGKKFGYIDKSGKVVIDFKYNYAIPFYDGKATVDFKSVIDKNGKELFSLGSNAGTSYSGFQNGYMPVCITNKRSTGFVNTKGKVVVEPKYYTVGGFSEGVALADYGEGRKVGFINSTGEVVLPFIYQKASNFSEGMAAVSILPEDVRKSTATINLVSVESQMGPDKTIIGVGEELGFYEFGKTTEEDPYLIARDKIDMLNGHIPIVNNDTLEKKDSAVTSSAVNVNQKFNLTIHLTDKETKENIKGKVIIRYSSGKVDSLFSENGVLGFSIEPGSLVSYEIKSSSYMPQGGTLQIGQGSEDKTFRLEKMVEGKAIVMDNVLFETGKYFLLEESQKELDRVVDLMNENPAMVIEVAGYTDYLGTDKLNLELSEYRVKEVVSYIVNKGISKHRISGKGYGEAKPLYVGDDMEKRKMNRRVEFNIVKL
jgi:outer membrane protein OmpA-like peptidoglycan-associated protein